MSEIIKCPVCGKEKKEVSLSDFDCEYCGFNNAFVKFFANEESYKQWKESVRTAVQNIAANKRSSFSDFRCLRLGSRTIAFLDLANGKIYIALGNGKIQVESDAVDFDSSELNYAIVYRNGSVKVFGNDNEFGQKSTESWNNVQQVLTAPNCTYGITKNGTITYAGSPVKSVLGWHDIKLLRSCEDYFIGIHNDGSVVLDENKLIYPELKDVENWHDIKDALLLRDGVVGLTNNGTVLFLGKNDDPKRACTAWKDIIAIETDNTYIYGLSQNGDLFVAGDCKKILDKGRKEASGWKNILAISCNKAGIGAINENGEFLFRGTIAGDKSKLIDVFNNQISSLI